MNWNTRIRRWVGVVKGVNLNELLYLLNPLFPTLFGFRFRMMNLVNKEIYCFKLIIIYNETRGMAMCVPNANFKWECIKAMQGEISIPRYLAYLFVTPPPFTRSGCVPHCHLSLVPNLTYTSLLMPSGCSTLDYWFFPKFRRVSAVCCCEWHHITSPSVSSPPQPTSSSYS